ncbi:MAG: class I SAM-dependent methyltransferase [Bacteroidetes bacterium]|nr:class I SAM-dependent methyltransferase [Bacteroidota bacterium]
MNPQAMEPFGSALLVYFEGCSDAEIVVHRDDGREAPLPASYFFREEADFTDIEKKAVAFCKGYVLDVGASTGLHSLALQNKGYRVTAIDISQHAVEIMKRRGVKDVQYADAFEFNGGPFDTLLMM